MSVVEYHTDRGNGSAILSDESDCPRSGLAPMRYRGWVLLALGLGSWAGLFKLLGWF